MYDIIFNPVSAKGKSRAALNIVEGVLQSKSIPYTVHETQYQGHAKELAAALSAQPVNLIVMGGDGTFNEVLNGIENFQNVVLGLIPCGTGNDFVRATTIPSDVQGALDIILRGDKGYVDFIQLGDRRALNCAGAGMDVDTLVRYETIKFFKGKLRYYAALIDVLLHTKFHKLRLTVDGVTQEKSVFLITAANGTCIGGGMPISPNSDPFDGKFDIVTSRAFHPLVDCYSYMSLLKKDGGKIVLYKAGEESINDELRALKAKGCSPTSSILELKVPFLNEKRNLLILD